MRRTYCTLIKFKMKFNAVKIVIIPIFLFVGKELNFDKENKFKIYEAYNGTLIKF